MARLVIHKDIMPKEIKVGNESKWVCMCGLTKNSPFCDGSHRPTHSEEEGKLYKYVDGERVEVDNF